MKTPAPPVWPMPVERRRPGTVLVAMKDLRPDLAMSKKGIKGNFYSHSLTKARLGNLAELLPKRTKNL